MNLRTGNSLPTLSLLAFTLLLAGFVEPADEVARGNAAYGVLSGEEKAAIDLAKNQLLVVYHSEDPALLRRHIEKLNQATMRLAELMMSTAVRSALKGTKIDD